MKIVENKEFWENDVIIATQDKIKPKSSDYEVYLYEKVANYLSDHNSLQAQILGCGTGREIPDVIKYIGVDHVSAIDIAENMIFKCKTNIIEWGLQDKVTAMVSDATQCKSANSFDLVTIMNNMMTYVIDKKERYTIFKNSFENLKPHGCVIGVVHNQVGSPQKTLYFKIRNIFSFFLREEAGYRLTGFKGMKFGGYYFTERQLKIHLRDSGFKNIEVISLSKFYSQKNFKYDKLKGYNNLLFFATKV